MDWPPVQGRSCSSPSERWKSSTPPQRPCPFPCCAKSNPHGNTFSAARLITSNWHLIWQICITSYRTSSGFLAKGANEQVYFDESNTKHLKRVFVNLVLSLKPCLHSKFSFSAFAPFSSDFYVFRQTRAEIDGSPTSLNCHKRLHRVP